MCWCFRIICVLLIIKLFIKMTTGRNYSNLCLVNKTALVVGGSVGMGYQVVLNLASRGCKVIIANRSKPDLEKIIEQTANPNIFYYHLDLASLDSVRKFVKIFKKAENSLDILINNSGLAGYNEYTEDGLDRVMQVNYFGHFLLNHLLADYLKESKGRIVFVNSTIALLNTIKKVDDINRPAEAQFVHTMWQYGNSKACQLAALGIMAKKLEPFGVIVAAVHPGTVHTEMLWKTVKSTPQILEKILFSIFSLYTYVYAKTVVEGADAILHCALEKNIKTGGFYRDCSEYWKPPITKNEKLCQEIWIETERLVQLSPEEKL